MAQLGERIPRTDEVRGSNPLGSTTRPCCATTGALITSLRQTRLLSLRRGRLRMWIAVLAILRWTSTAASQAGLQRTTVHRNRAQGDAGTSGWCRRDEEASSWRTGRVGHDSTCHIGSSSIRTTWRRLPGGRDLLSSRTVATARPSLVNLGRDESDTPLGGESARRHPCYARWFSYDDGAIHTTRKKMLS